MIMWDELVIVAIVGLALILNLACYNDRYIRESSFMAARRRLIIVAQMLLLVWLGISLVDHGDAFLNRPSFFIFMLWGLGSCMGSLDHIARRWGREISELLKPRVYYERRKHRRYEHSHHP